MTQAHTVSTITKLPKHYHLLRHHHLCITTSTSLHNHYPRRRTNISHLGQKETYQLKKCRLGRVPSWLLPRFRPLPGKGRWGRFLSEEMGVGQTPEVLRGWWQPEIRRYNQLRLVVQFILLFTFFLRFQVVQVFLHQQYALGQILFGFLIWTQNKKHSNHIVLGWDCI